MTWVGTGTAHPNDRRGPATRPGALRVGIGAASPVAVLGSERTVAPVASNAMVTVPSRSVR
jgi:hypothetical protein